MFESFFFKLYLSICRFFSFALIILCNACNFTISLIENNQNFWLQVCCLCKKINSFGFNLSKQKKKRTKLKSKITYRQFSLFRFLAVRHRKAFAMVCTCNGKNGGGKKRKKILKKFHLWILLKKPHISFFLLSN